MKEAAKFGGFGKSRGKHPRQAVHGFLNPHVVGILEVHPIVAARLEALSQVTLEPHRSVKAFSDSLSSGASKNARTERFPALMLTSAVSPSPSGSDPKGVSTL